MFGWTAEGPWVSSGTRPCAGGALQIWHIFKQLIELLEVLVWVPDAVTVKDASPKSTDGVVNGNLVVDRRQLRLESQELAVVLPQGFFLQLLAE
jgi:hypothetical protein